MKIRKNITISDTMLQRGEEIAKARGFDDFSEMVSALLREEYERRIGPSGTATELREAPTPYKVSSTVDPVEAAAQEALNILTQAPATLPAAPGPHGSTPTPNPPTAGPVPKTAYRASPAKAHPPTGSKRGKSSKAPKTTGKT